MSQRDANFHATAVSYNWCLTLNNPTSAELKRLTEETASPQMCRYIVWQLEKGPEESTPHVQGYLVLHHSARMSKLKRFIRRGHWEVRLGEHWEARDYCKKEETRVKGPFEGGKEPVGRGHRSDMDQVKSDIDCGLSLRTLWDRNFANMARYGRGINQYRTVAQGARDWPMEVIVLFGPPGIGKSKFLFKELVQSVEEVYPLMQVRNSTVWWDSYDGEEVVGIDDCYGWLPWGYLLKLLDRYPMLVETKGGSCHFRSKMIVITSKAHPNTWYKYDDKIRWEALDRRISRLLTRNSGEEDWIDLKQPTQVVQTATTSRVSHYRPAVCQACPQGQGSASMPECLAAAGDSPLVPPAVPPVGGTVPLRRGSRRTRYRAVEPSPLEDEISYQGNSESQSGIDGVSLEGEVDSSDDDLEIVQPDWSLSSELQASNQGSQRMLTLCKPALSSQRSGTDGEGLFDSQEDGAASAWAPYSYVSPEGVSQRNPRRQLF